MHTAWVVFTLAAAAAAALAKCGKWASNVSTSVLENHARYVRLGAGACDPTTPSGAAVQRLQSMSCPARWAVSCLDHFNCDAILKEDVIEPMAAGLAALGFDDVWIGRASECDANCFTRQHLVVNANLMNAAWAQRIPPSSILVNLEQLVERSAADARRAAAIAVEVFANDAAVAAAGRRALETATNESRLGATVDDARGFVALDDVAKAYPWLDYSYRNLDLLSKHSVCAFPKGIGVTAKSASREAPPRDLDVVHVGGVGVERRTRVVDQLRLRGRAAFVVEGAFRDDRDDVLRRSKLGLNIKRSSNRLVPEIPRILAYAKSGLPVLAETSTWRGDTILEAELRSPAVHFVNYEMLVECADAILSNETTLRDMRRHAARLVAQRSERDLLVPALNFLLPTCNLA